MTPIPTRGISTPRPTRWATAICPPSRRTRFRRSRKKRWRGRRARLLNLPIVIARMNVAYGVNGGLAIFHLDSVVTDRPIAVRWDPAPYSPIFQDDINEQVEPILAAASVPATIVNWGGDEVVTVQEWSSYFGELTGRTSSSTLGPRRALIAGWPSTSPGGWLSPDPAGPAGAGDEGGLRVPLPGWGGRGGRAAVVGGPCGRGPCQRTNRSVGLRVSPPAPPGESRGGSSGRCWGGTPRRAPSPRPGLQGRSRSRR